MKRLCKSKNGHEVFVDEQNTNIGLHILENPNLLELAKEAIIQSEVVGEKVALEMDLGRVIGSTSMVAIGVDDEIIWAKRKDRERYSKFVKNRELVPTSKVVAILFQKEYGYLLWSGWCGELLPQEPGGAGGTRTSRAFDKTHAMVFDEVIIQMDTITEVDPAK